VFFIIGLQGFETSSKLREQSKQGVWEKAPVGLSITKEENPFRSTKKEVTFVYQKLLFLSKPQAWHIISPNGAVYHPSLCDGISSRHSRA